MKAIRLALLLGVASTLVGCNNNGPHTITFTGNNCSMSYKMGEAPITAPITVDHGKEANFVIYNEDSDTYAVPDKLDIQGQAEVTYSPAGQISSQASLILKNITSDITITANARERGNICSITYYSDDYSCQWDKDSNPGSIMKGGTLVAHLNVEKGYTFTKENIFVIVGQEQLSKDKYNFTNNNELTISGEYITGNIVLAAGYILPDVGTYKINFTMPHAESHFPTEEIYQGIPFDGYFVASEGYRVPTKKELVDGKCIRKICPDVDSPLRDDQFYYETYTTENGRSAAYLLVYDMKELSNAEEVIIGGFPVEQVKVTFQVGEGHWQEGTEAKQDKIGIVDINSTLDDAAMACGASTTPVVDNPAKRFDAWLDTNGQPVSSTKELTEDLIVHASFAFKEYTINIDAVKKITITGLPTDPVKYHAAVTGVTFTPSIEHHKLPDSIIVRMSTTDGYIPLVAGTQYTYVPDATKTSATFGINANVIEGNITIEATAIQYVTVTFNPGEGTWPVAEDQDPIPTEVPAGSTYGDAFKLTKDRTPECAGKTFAGWRKEGTETYVTMEDQIDDVASITIICTFTDIVTFATDSWANVIEHAKNGYAPLKEYYGDSLFIGATRLINYTNPTTKEETIFTVRVIDYGYDHYYNDKGEVTASALTFEFVELVGEGEYGSASASEGSNNWQQSTYRSWLNNFYTQIKAQNAGFEAKKAIKYTLQGRSTKPADKITTQDYFFPMSGAEINIAAINSEVNETTYQDGQRENEGLLQGTLPYARYMNGTTSRLKKLNGTNTAYWLRSPHVNFEEWQMHSGDYDQNECYYIKNTGGTSTDYAGTQTSAYSYWEHGYMAAFCI